MNREGRNAETVEDLLEQLGDDYEGLRAAFEAGDPHTISFLHDQVEINKVLNQTLDQHLVNDYWHNTAIEFTTDGMAHHVMDEIMATGRLFESVAGQVRLAMQLGYLLGKQADIKMCKCDVRPTHN